MTQKQFERLMQVAREREEARSQYRIKMDSRYGGCNRVHWTQGERTKYEKLSESADRAFRKFLDAIYEISPRNWSSNIPAYWILENMTWDMATTRDALPVIPPMAWGATHDNSRFAGAL